MNTNFPMLCILLTLLVIWLIIRIIKITAEKYFKKQEFIDLSRQTDDVTELYEKLLAKKLRIQNSFCATFSPIIIDGKIQKVKDAQNTYLCEDEIFNNLESVNGVRYFFGFSETPAIKQKATDIKNQLVSLNKSVDELKDLKNQMLNIVNDSIPKWIMRLFKSQTLLLLGLQIDLSKLENNNFTYTVINQKSKQEKTITIDEKMLNNFTYQHEQKNERYDLNTINDLLKSIGGPNNDR